VAISGSIFARPDSSLAAPYAGWKPALQSDPRPRRGPLGPPPSLAV